MSFFPEARDGLPSSDPETGFGPPSTWPASLRVAADICLSSTNPGLLWWGPKLDILYNDAFLSWMSAATT
jgi:hypothetical protein